MPHTETDRAADARRRRRDQVRELVGADRRVLLVEPEDDALAGALAERGCQVVDGFTGQDGLGHLDDTFDVVVLDDLLTTAADPQTLIKDAASLLTDGGWLVATAPNAAHAARRLALLGGDLPVAEVRARGALVRQVTLDSLCDLFEDAALVVSAVHAVVLDPVESDVPIAQDRLPDAVVEWVRHQPEGLCDSFAIAARPRGVDEQEAPRPRVRADRPLEEVRVVDAHTERARALAEDAHRRLTQRDAIIGLEATAQHAELRRELALSAVKEWKRRTRKWRAAHEELAAEVVRVAGQRKPGEALRALADRCRTMVRTTALPADDDS